MKATAQAHHGRTAHARSRTLLNFKTAKAMLKATVQSWSEHKAMKLGAPLAYYTLFAIAPLFLIALAIAGMWFGDLGHSSAASSYRAAGSVVIILLWVFYSSQILFLGAEFTRVYAEQHGARLKPATGAELVTLKAVKSSAAHAH